MSCNAEARRDAYRHMVDLLWLAHEGGCEAELASLLAEDLSPRLSDPRDLKMRLEPRRRNVNPVDKVVISLVAASSSHAAKSPAVPLRTMAMNRSTRRRVIAKAGTAAST